MRELFEKLSYFYPSVSLHLCVNLCYQYPWMVSKLVSNVQKNTQAYISHPDTLIPFLSSQELQNLADSTDFFNTCTFVLPIVSLMVLQKCFNHEKLVTFALASLSHFPPATIFFYVPQIVQLLRKDPFGSIVMI